MGVVSLRLFGESDGPDATLVLELEKEAISASGGQRGGEADPVLIAASLCVPSLTEPKPTRRRTTTWSQIEAA